MGIAEIIRLEQLIQVDYSFETVGRRPIVPGATKRAGKELGGLLSTTPVMEETNTTKHIARRLAIILLAEEKK
jgi:hypothetical protein